MVCAQERPYQDDSTASRLLSEVKHPRAWLVLRWGTTLESQVLFFSLLLKKWTSTPFVQKMDFEALCMRHRTMHAQFLNV